MITKRTFHNLAKSIPEDRHRDWPGDCAQSRAAHERRSGPPVRGRVWLTLNQGKYYVEVPIARYCLFRITKTRVSDEMLFHVRVS